jgi:hydrogenase nickel incorporation protein HypA/HybF
VHEMGIARSILDIALDAARKGGAKRIGRVTVVAGELRSIVPLQLTFYFSLLAENTTANGAELVIETMPVTLRCNTCGETFRAEEHGYQCPRCGSRDLETIGGTELRVKDIEVDDT